MDDLSVIPVRNSFDVYFRYSDDNAMVIQHCFYTVHCCELKNLNDIDPLIDFPHFQSMQLNDALSQKPGKYCIAFRGTICYLGNNGFSAFSDYDLFQPLQLYLVLDIKVE